MRKHLLMMVVEQLIDEYREQGYEVKTQYPINFSFRADLFAVRDDERLVIEIVNSVKSPDSIKKIEAIVKDEGFELKVIDISKVTFEKPL